MKVVRLSAYAPAAFITQEVFLVLISVQGRVNPRAIVWPEGLWQWSPTECDECRRVWSDV